MEIVEGDPNDVDSWGYAPATLTVPVGTTIRWLNRGVQPHTATHQDNETFETGLLLAGKMAEVTFETPGEVQYKCRIHPWMTAKIIVTATG